MLELVNIVRDLRAMGVGGRAVLVHTSLRSVGRGIDARNYLADWREAVTDNGVLLVPTFTGQPTDHPERPPTFDVIHSRAARIGVVPVIATEVEGGYRSMHCTHSVVGFGRDSAEILADHFDSYTPCDAHSPFAKLVERDGLIALVGCTQTSNTSIHMCEEFADVPYHLIPGEGTATVIDAEGNHLEQLSRFHSWATDRDFQIIDKDLTALGIQTFHAVGDAVVRLIKAKELHDWLVPRLKAYPYLLCKPK